MSNGTAPAAASSTPPAEPGLTFSAFWLLSARIVSFALNVLLPLLIVRRLSQVEFGHYKQVFLAVSTATMVVPLGFASTAFYFFAREPQRRREIVLNVLLVYAGIGAVAAAVLLAWPGMLSWLFGDAAVAQFAPALAMLLPLWMLSGLLEVIPVVNREFRTATLIIVASQVSRTAVVVAAVLWDASVWSVLWATSLHAGAQVCTLLWYCSRRFPGFWRHWDASLLRAQVVYALPLGWTVVLWGLQNDLHSYFVSHHYGPVVFAVYAVGCFQIPLIGTLTEAAASVLIGRVSELRVSQRNREIVEVTARAARKLSAVIFAVYAFFMVTGPEFLTLMFTEQYRASWPFFAVNLTMLLLLPFLIDPVMRACPERMVRIARLRTAVFILAAAALWMFVPRFGPLSAIAIVVIATFLDRAVTVYVLAPAVGFRVQDLRCFSDTARIAVFAALAAAVTAALRPFTSGLPPIVFLLVSGICFSAVYAALVSTLLTTDERATAGRLVRSPVSSLRAVLGRPTA